MELSVVQKIVTWALPLIFAITVHEVAHGWVANRLGDPTARIMGRLTLNPFKHIDLFGTVLVPVLLLSISNFVFGWAKPVPVDQRNFRRPRLDAALVACAGPIANFLMALIWAGIGRFGLYLLTNQFDWIGTPLLYMGSAGVMVNVVLCVLNLMPIPPLDGSKIIYSLLPGRVVWNLRYFETIGFVVLMLLWVTGVLSYFMAPPVIAIIHWISTTFGISAAL